MCDGEPAQPTILGRYATRPHAATPPHNPASSSIRSRWAVTNDENWLWTFPANPGRLLALGKMMLETLLILAGDGGIAYCDSSMAPYSTSPYDRERSRGSSKEIPRPAEPNVVGVGPLKSARTEAEDARRGRRSGDGGP